MPAQPSFTPGQATVYAEPSEITRVVGALRGAGRTVALVPTMGALHAGHRELIRSARRIPGAHVAVSIFVNPLQFGPNEDLEAYPRRLEADLAACRDESVDLVFAPGAEQMYPDGPNTVTVRPGPLGEELEGASRPGHFAGVLTVVAKLLGIVRPDHAVFGEKDYQQLVLVRRMVAELNMGTRIVGAPTVRQADGLAISSRNAYLSAEQRENAVALSAALTAGAHAGHRGAEAALTAARDVLAAAGGVELDYLVLRGSGLGPAPADGVGRLLVAGRVGGTRLIDNVPVALGDSGVS
jgi:pantoate--beta-alanine ligase